MSIAVSTIGKMTCRVSCLLSPISFLFFIFLMLPHSPAPVLGVFPLSLKNSSFPPSPGILHFEQEPLVARLLQGKELPMTAVGGQTAVSLNIVRAGRVSISLSGQFSHLQKRTKINT